MTLTMASVFGVLKSFLTNIGHGSLSRPFLRTRNFLIESHRTTWVLKRRIPPTTVRRTVDPHWLQHKLDPLHQEYLVVENDYLKMKTLSLVDVVLTNVVEDVGQRGQVVQLEPMTAYELVILGQAAYATPHNLAKIRSLSDSEFTKYSSLTAYKTMKKLTKMNLPVFMNMHEPWTIEPWHIRVNYRLNGFQMLKDDNIELPRPIKGPNLDLEGKDFVVYITINNSERFPVRCRLRHFTKIYSQRIILPLDHMCIPSVPIFPEENEILDKIPLPDKVDDNL